MTPPRRPTTPLERVACAAAWGLGLWVLATWALGYPALSSFLPGMPPVKPGVALWVILMAMALPLTNRQGGLQRTGSLLAGLALATGLAQLVIALFPSPLVAWLPNPLTSLSLALSTLALLFRDHPWRPRLDPSGTLALLAMVVPYMALLGYLIELAVLYRPVSTEATSLPTATTLILLSCAIVASRPERGWMALWRRENLGGTLLRRQVPAVLLAPLALGMLAFAGERAHLFSEQMGMGFVLALSALAGVAHTFWTASSLDRLEEARISAVHDLQGSEAMFRGLMEGASDAILILDEANRIAFKNRQVASLFGYDSGELIGQAIDSLVPERYRTSHAEYRSAYMRAPRRQTHDRPADLYGRRKDGSEFPAEVSLSPVETVEGRYVMVLIRDLTERRRAAEAIAALNAELQRHNEEIEAEVAARTRELARRNELVDRAIHHIPAGVAFVDADLTIRWINPEYSRQLGIPMDELVNRTVTEALPGIDMERLLSLRELQIGHSIRFTGAPMRLESGLTYWDTSLVPAFEDGSYQGFFVLANEVTARIELERMQKAHIAALERADALKDEFLNIVSHELRAPISVLSGTISLLEYEVDGPLSASQRRDVARMRESTDHLLMLVNDLLDMSMIHAGKLTIVPKRLVIGDLVEAAIDFVQPLANERRISIHTEVAPDLPTIDADPQRLRQVLINLVSNALKYSPPQSAVVLRVRAERHALRLEVADEGAGIRPVDQERIFEKFTRLDAQQHPDGAGLGLYICRALVAAHQGEIGVVSDGEQGSTFWVTLPVTR